MEQLGKWVCECQQPHLADSLLGLGIMIVVLLVILVLGYIFLAAVHSIRIAKRYHLSSGPSTTVEYIGGPKGKHLDDRQTAGVQTVQVSKRAQFDRQTITAPSESDHEERSYGSDTYHEATQEQQRQAWHEIYPDDPQWMNSQQRAERTQRQAEKVLVGRK